MDGQEMINITVLIAGRPFPLKVRIVDEPAIRQIVVEVNDKINHFQQTYKNKSKLECISMALLTNAVELHKSKISTADDASTSVKLSQLDKLLNSLLA